MPQVDNLVYRNTTVDFNGKGSPLTSLEGDYNNFKVKTDVANIFAQLGAVGAGIAEITQPTANTLTITLTDSTAFGPFVLPTTPITGRGVWTPLTDYAVNDLLYYGSSIYIVPFAHTSAATFDPGANDGDGNNFYDFVFDFSVGAATYRQATTKTEADATHPITSDDIGSLWLCTNVSGCEITIPNDTTYNAPIDTETSFVQRAAGPLTFVTEAGVTYNSGVTAFEASTDDIGAVVTLKKVESNEWIGFGRFVEPTA